ncbi:MAG: hypothetical protein WCL06_14230 [Bacteroidota bacterium]
MKRIISVVVFALIIITFSASRSSAQLFTGGNLSTTFINGVKIDLAPVIGYKIQKFSVGLSPVAQYTASSIQGFAGDFSYGASLFAEYDIIKGVFVHVEGKAMNTGYLDNSGIKQHGWVIGAPIGVGYEYEIAKNVWFKGMALYDPFVHINLVQNLPNSNPTVSGGITYVF